MLLKLGSRGDAVRELQQHLSLVPDGIFGQNTEKAVEDFQRAHNLTIDGRAGPQTLPLIETAAAAAIQAAAAGAAHLWPHEDEKALTAFYGNPRGSSGTVNAQWAAQNLVAVSPPWKMVASWDTEDIIHHFAFHKKCKASLDAILLSLFEQCNKDQDKIEAAGLHLFGGSFNYRPKRTVASLSCHARGIALDINPEVNPQKADWNPKTMPRFVVDTFKDAKVMWGGDFKHTKDTMHFQFAWD